MGRRLIEGLLQAKADEEPLWCGDWCEKRCGENIKHIFQGFMGVKNPGSLSIRGSQEDYWKGLDWASLYSGLDHVFIFVSVMFSIIPVWYLHEPDLSYARTDNGGLARYICKTEWILCQKNCIFGHKFCIFLRYTYETPFLRVRRTGPDWSHVPHILR